MQKGKKQTILHRIKIIEMSKPEICNKNNTFNNRTCFSVHFNYLYL